MSYLATLVRWDWFKLARRWMPWILLAILLVFSQLAVWGNYFRYRNLEQTGGTVAIGPEGPGRVEVDCNALLAGKAGVLPSGTSPGDAQALANACRGQQASNQRRLAQLDDGFTLPGSIPNALGIGVSIGLILLAILAASMVGAEYGWGTVRTTLVRGTGRWRYLAAKLVLLALVAAAFFVIVVAATAISSEIARGLVAHPVRGVTTSWSHALDLLGRSWFALIPYVVLTVLFTVITRSSATGMAIGIVYYPAEQIVVAILSGIFSWFGTVGKYLLGQNLATWSGVEVIGAHAPVSTLHAFIVVVIYSLILGAIAFYLFRRADVTGASAG